MSIQNQCTGPKSIGFLSSICW